MSETNETIETKVEGSAPVEETEVLSDEAMKTAMDGVEQELDKAKKEIDTLKDSWLRERAEFQNYKRRTANDLLNARKESIKRFAEGFLGALDNLERVTSVTNASDEVKAFIDGISMIQKEFLGVLEKEGIKRLDPTGIAFDPMFMEAIVSEESPDFQEETVVETYQKGYYFEDGDSKQPIRPARVKVGKPQS
ncbi:heat shock protein GrpE [Leptospira ryugenii]|uniref:Protein GrpE n=1 Tax=Leptospira ryugenii TaxID=1917863 RepID=A0A2P2E3D3_9LEPT|nr:nucleotide exchange factor GrpE [Leptospira ryugenii]GBF51413.1 heat shock protein GrpE [Leptospira ryugenii]